MRYAVKILSLALGMPVLLPAMATAQDAGTPQASAIISGTVIDAVTRQPVKGAQVRARNLSPGQSGAPRAGSSTTDAEGRFTIDGLTEGRYIIFASLEGYVGQHVAGAGLSSRLITVGPGQHTNDLLVELTPGAVISGHVKSAESKPLAGVAVELLRYFQSDGGKQLRGVNAPVFTDAAGEYHIHGVPAGNYYLRAVPPTKSDVSKVAPKTALAPTYFGNVTEPTTAATVPVRPGSFFAGMDFTLTPLHAVSVKGKILIVGKVPPSGQVQVSLISNDSATSQHETKPDAKGDFEFQGITSGDYTLVARIEPTNAKTKMFWGQRPLHVSNADLRNADLRIAAGLQLNGRIRADEKGSTEFAHMTADLLPQGNSAVAALMPSVDNVSVRPDGSFTFNDVPEGTHLLDINPLPQGYFLKSNATPDVLESGVTISNAQSPPTLELTLSPDAAQLTGSVLNDQMPASGASVVLIPQGGRSNQLRFGKRSVTDQSGRFSMKSIVPGDYKILAFQAVERSFLSDPEFLARFEDRGESIHIREGDTLNVSLDAIPADESIP
jgi:hypothetical protein